MRDGHSVEVVLVRPKLSIQVLEEAFLLVVCEHLFEFEDVEPDGDQVDSALLRGHVLLEPIKEVLRLRELLLCEVNELPSNPLNRIRDLRVVDQSFVFLNEDFSGG